MSCPKCDIEFSDWAADWCDAWMEGRRDLLVEQDLQERDGPCKIACELCGARSWVNYFANSVKLV